MDPKAFNGSYDITTIPKFRYSNKNDFIKKFRSLKTYCPRAYKELIFKTSKNEFQKEKDGKYEINLYTSSDFKFIYGQIILLYSVIDGIVIIEDLSPRDFFIAGYYSFLEIYKGIPCRDNRDKFKVDLLKTKKRKENL